MSGVHDAAEALGPYRSRKRRDDVFGLNFDLYSASIPSALRTAQANSSAVKEIATLQKISPSKLIAEADSHAQLG